MNDILPLQEEKEQKLKKAFSKYDQVTNEYHDYITNIDPTNFDVEEMLTRLKKAFDADEEYTNIENRLNHTHEKTLREEIENEIEKRAEYGYWDHGLELLDENDNL